MKLNLGCGKHTLPGYENWDITNGHAAYPLEVEDNSCDEIRASHVLEHLSQRESILAVKQWIDKLKPGGTLKIAVPDAEEVIKKGIDVPINEAYLVGGQKDEFDYHKSAWSKKKLENVFRRFGLEKLERWESELDDCATYPFSLNLMGRKPENANDENLILKTKAIMSVPRYGQMAARGIIDRALNAFELPLHTSQGVYWAQCMDRAFDRCVEEGIDWILAIDYDSVFNKHHLNTLFHHLGQNPHIDGLAALQSRRGGDTPLLTIGDVTKIELDDNLQPFRVVTAHFGLTLLRVDKLAKMKRPFFECVPGKGGSWEPESGKVDADITFWQRWNEAGNSIYVDPQVRIGHVEELVCWYDEGMNLQTTSVEEWRQKFEPDRIPTKRKVDDASKVPA